jgi:uncharacterized protein (UPF0216 family)
MNEKLLLKILRRSLVKGDSLEQCQDFLSQWYSPQEVEYFYNLVSNTKDSLLSKRITIRMSESLYNSIQETGKVPSKFIKSVLEAHFSRESSQKAKVSRKKT